MVYLIGDTHGATRPVMYYCKQHQMTEDDILIILGDAGYNYYLDSRDTVSKNRLKKLKPTIFCIHGNHECRPEHIASYKTKEWHGGTVWYEEKFPKLLFARDGDVFEFHGLKCLVIGGAYSVDKPWRINRNDAPWWKDEQPSIESKARALKAAMTQQIDVVFSHTCPMKFIPQDAFLPSVDQSTVDTTTEQFLDVIEAASQYKSWYCGHFHIDRDVDKIHFLFQDIMQLYY